MYVLYLEQEENETNKR